MKGAVRRRGPAVPDGTTGGAHGAVEERIRDGDTAVQQGCRALWLREFDLQGDVAGDDCFSALDIELGQRGRIGAHHHGGPRHGARVEASTGCVNGADPGPLELECFEQGAGLGFAILSG